LPEMAGLEHWALFSLGAGTLGNSFSGSTVNGDVGAAGNANVSLSSSTLNGALYYGSNGTLQMSGGSVITGATIHDQDAVLNSVVAGALAVSGAASDLAANRPFTKFNLKNTQTAALTGAPGETVVLNLKTFALSGSAAMTLNGTATTNFVINVKSKFSLLDNSRIVLAGGMNWNNVLFNVVGKGANAKIAGQSSFEGTLMANFRTVQVQDRATVWGQIIANRILLSGGTQITLPPITSP
ncbi:MAG TPA: ice-binding family protein, partial [Chthoniobacterales bacterium]